MDCNVGHLWIPAFKDLGPLLLPVRSGSDTTCVWKDQTRPEKWPDQTIPTGQQQTNQSSPDGFMLVRLETRNLLSLQELFWAQSFSPQLNIILRISLSRCYTPAMYELSELLLLAKWSKVTLHWTEFGYIYNIWSLMRVTCSIFEHIYIKYN